jgi:hypothetical protein
MSLIHSAIVCRLSYNEAVSAGRSECQREENVRVSRQHVNILNSLFSRSVSIDSMYRAEYNIPLDPKRELQRLDQTQSEEDDNYFK